LIRIARILTFLLLCNLFYIPVQAKSFSFSESEVTMLAKLIKTEAGSESMQGKIAVGNVVMNRVIAYNSTITSILNTPNQFAYNPHVTPNDDCYAAAKRVLYNKEWVVPSNCHYFKSSGPPANGYATWSGKKDDIRTFWGKIGGNYFYLRDPDGIGASGQRITPPMYTYEYDTPRIGTKPSDEVVQIQELLIICGYDVVADGYFGEGTDVAVKDFQTKAKVKADGIVGEETLNLIKQEVNRIAIVEKQKKSDEYFKKIEPDLIMVYNKKLIIEGFDNIIIKHISKFKMDNHIENLKEYNFDVDFISVDLGGFELAEKNHYLSNAD